MALNKHNYHIMAPTLEYNTHPWSWSPCSAAMLAKFLEFVIRLYFYKKNCYKKLYLNLIIALSFLLAKKHLRSFEFIKQLRNFYKPQERETHQSYHLIC